jgi:UDP-3-O-[3-hydroxymyristoyl] N-acetylglucosamine deacetylase
VGQKNGKTPPAARFQEGLGHMTAGRQTTLRTTITIEGHGVHTASAASVTIRPAAANHGIVFIRKGLEGGLQRRLPGRYGNVSMTELCTVLGDPNFGAVSTVEHLMAALYGLGVDNALIDIDGPEVPIMDGSADAFVTEIKKAGVTMLPAARRYVRVKRAVRVASGSAWTELRPHEHGLRLDMTIDFRSGVIGRQQMVMDLDPASFVTKLARSRTFGFMRDVEQLWKNGYALGASLENTIAIGDDCVINPEGLRFEDEFVRHKMLDAVGDIAMAGLPMLGQFTSYCGGHRLNIDAIKALFSDAANFEIVEDVEQPSARRVQMAAAAYAPAVG